MFKYIYIYIYIYIHILVSGNILNKSLFMQVEIAKNLLLFSETTTIFFYINHVLFLICSTLESFFFLFFYFSLYKYIVCLEMSTRKYASRYEKLKKGEKKKN